VPYSEWTRYLQEFSPDYAVTSPPPGLYCPVETASPIDGWDAIGEPQLAEFRERGFLVIKNAFQAEEVKAALESVDALLGGAVPGYQPEPWGKKHGVLLRPGRSLETLDSNNRLEAFVLARALVEHDPRLMSLATHAGLDRFLTTVMHDTPVLVHNMARTKPPSEGDKPWHQDLTHFNVDPSFTVVTAWIAIDDAPLEAGCLHFIPGSLRLGPARHVFIRDYQIPDEEVRRNGQIAAPVEKGSCVLLNALVQHGSPPNRTAARRLALQMTFKPANARAITNEERIMAFSGQPWARSSEL
jgi:ectoine hydroxylase-related dioxygenase (phytanoyl-CoA dioxygenase family)